ncbi:MAG: hypothetical protein ACRDXB_02185, partial [Actinomycetes bacterium]
MAVLAARLRHGQEQRLVPEPQMELAIDAQFLRLLSVAASDRLSTRSGTAHPLRCAHNLASVLATLGDL